MKQGYDESYLIIYIYIYIRYKRKRVVLRLKSVASTVEWLILKAPNEIEQINWVTYIYTCYLEYRKF
jgi:hypothetical protein